MCIGNHDYGTYCGKGNSINQVKYGRKSQKMEKNGICQIIIILILKKIRCKCRFFCN